MRIFKCEGFEVFKEVFYEIVKRVNGDLRVVVNDF